MRTFGDYANSSVVGESGACCPASSLTGIPTVFGIAETSFILSSQSDGGIGRLPIGRVVVSGDGRVGGV